MIRRPLIAATALVAALALSSCATFTDNANAARVGDVELSSDSLASLVQSSDATGASDSGTLDGDVVRSTITKWVRVVVLESENGVPADQAASTENLDSRLSTALTQLATGNLDGAQEFYDAGPTTSGTVCLGAIPVATPDDTAAVMDALSSGTSFADAAAQFSVDETLAGNGGVVTDDKGAECRSAAQLNPDFAQPAAANPVGSPFVVETGDFNVVLVVRPFAELKPETQLDIALTANGTTLLPGLVSGADVHIDPRYGYWNATNADVVPLGS